MPARWARSVTIAAAAASLVTLAAVASAFADGARVGSEAEVMSDDGLNLRAKPDAASALVSVINPTHRVFVIDGPETNDAGQWFKVEYDGDVGWALGSYLGPARPRELSARGNASGRDEDTPRSTAQPSAAGKMRVGAEAQVASDDGLNMRASPGLEGEIKTLVKRTRYLYILDGPQIFDSGPWYKVDYDGDIGWVLGTYLEAARPREAPPTVRRDADSAPGRESAAPQPVAAPPPAREQPKTASTGGVGRGQAIAQKALGLVGSRYAWGGSSPRTGFDCSGLVSYVMNAFGVYPGRTSDDQAGTGAHVGTADLQPGDIVVFANTYEGGYSHTGIYVGGGRFVHAEDYATGVIVSSTFGGYWGRHYAGARRPW